MKRSTVLGRNCNIASTEIEGKVEKITDKLDL